MAKKRKEWFLLFTGMSIFCLYLFVCGLCISVQIIEDWRLTPDHLTDSTCSFFSGLMFFAACLLLGTLTDWRTEKNRRLHNGVFYLSIVCMLLFPIWSIAITGLRFSTTFDYDDNLQLGICEMKSARGHKTEIYVPDTDWCLVNGYDVKRPSPEKAP